MIPREIRTQALYIVGEVSFSNGNSNSAAELPFISVSAAPLWGSYNTLLTFVAVNLNFIAEVCSFGNFKIQNSQRKFLPSCHFYTENISG